MQTQTSGQAVVTVPRIPRSGFGDDGPASIVRVPLWWPVDVKYGPRAYSLELQRPGERRPKPESMLITSDRGDHEQIEINHLRLLLWLQRLTTWFSTDLRKIDLRDYFDRIVQPAERLLVDPDGPRSIPAPAQREPEDERFGFVIGDAFHPMRRATINDLIKVGELQCLRIFKRNGAVSIVEDPLRLRAMAARLLGTSTATIDALNLEGREQIFHFTRVLAQRPDEQWEIGR